MKLLLITLPLIILILGLMFFFTSRGKNRSVTCATDIDPESFQKQRIAPETIKE